MLITQHIYLLITWSLSLGPRDEGLGCSLSTTNGDRRVIFVGLLKVLRTTLPKTSPISSVVNVEGPLGDT